MSSVIFGLVPALAFTRDAHGQPLHSSRAGSLMLRSRRLHRGLVLSEVALSIVPLIAAGLMLRTFANLLEAPIGFDPAHVVTARVSLNLGEFSTVDRRSAFYRDAIARVRELPGVEAASVGGPPPLAPVQTTQRFWRSEDREPAPSIGMQQSIMPGYFGVMGIPLRAGRDISDDDISHRRRVVVVDERLAAQLWNGDADRQTAAVGEAKQPLEVVGVAGHIRARDIRDSGTPMIYVPSHVYEIEQTLVVKTRAPLSTIGPAIKQAVEALGPGRPVFDIRPMDDIVEASIDNTRFTMLVLSGFAIASLVLAGVGLYGTLAYLTSQRTQEFGVRLALGASAASILRLVIREGCLLTGLGAALGLAGAIAVTRALRGLLYGVTPLDGLTIASVVALVAVRGARRRRLAGLARGAHRSDDGAARGVGRTCGTNEPVPYGWLFSRSEHFRDGYSARSAAHGSILVARRAGSHAAISPTAISSSVTIVNAIGSVGVTPNRNVCSTRVTPTAPARPTITPATTMRSARVSTRRSTSPRSAPSAMRTPISRRRCVTV